jgi:3-dehydroquinate dehydratase / shikimate dehydrogenase
MAKICVPVCALRLNELEHAIGQAAEVADIIELRFDCVDKERLTEALRDFDRLRKLARQPFIITFRPAEQGGHRAIALNERIDFWLNQNPFYRPQPGDFADIEAELLIDQSPNTEYWRSQLPSHSLICSHHDFVGMPPNLDALYEQIAATSASVTKIAVHADDAIDCIPIFQLLERAQTDGREMIAIAMGHAGIMTRILGPSRGSFLTYGSLDNDSATAPGQVTANELREVYRIDHLNRESEIFGIIGNPVNHSLSPRIHNASFAAGELNAVFIPFEVRDAVQFLRRMAHPKSREIDWNLRGLSVTAPHKATVIPYLDWVDASAKEIGAVNTIVAQDSQLLGYNTDALGFIMPLRKKFSSLRTARCAIIGAGGATRACLWALRKEGAECTLFVRNTEKASGLARQFEVESRQLADAHFGEFDIVINATPLGTFGERESATAATAEQLRGVRLAYDLVYNPLQTRFLREARDAGCDTLGGIEMLLSQATEQFKLWTGKEADEMVMRTAALSGLTQH